MKLSIPLAAVVAAQLATVAAIAVPVPWPAFRSLQPIRDSSPLERVPTTDTNTNDASADPGLRRVNADDTKGIERISVPDTPGRRIGHGGLRREGVERDGVERDPVLDVVRVIVVSTVTSTQFSTVTTTGTITPSAAPSVTPSGNLSTTAAPSLSSTSSCDLRYCDNGTSWCEYWGGYSSFDVSAGRPIPGETRSSIGVCSTRASPGPVDSTTTSAYESASSGGSSSGSSSIAYSSSSGIPSSSSSEDPLDSITCTSTIKSLVSSGSTSSTSASSSSSSSSSSTKSASKRA